MKVIDLLNKIANGEEVPKKIKYLNIVYEYRGYMYCTENANYQDIDDYLFGKWNFNILNNEVEIIEEKKIPEKIEIYKDKNNEVFLDDLCYKYMPIHKDSLSFNEQVIVDKLNEVLDYLQSKGE